jgi:hypothetical protein
MGLITINCYEMDFSNGVVHYVVAGMVLGIIFLISALANFVPAILYPSSLIPQLPSIFRARLEVFCCTYCSVT